MNSLKVCRLKGEDRMSIGRWFILIGFVSLFIGLFATIIPDYISGAIYKYSSQTWWFTIFGIGFFSIMIVVGVIVHKIQKWPEFEIRIYEDGWLWYKIHGNGQIKDTETWIPGDLLVRIKRYKRKYSKIRKNWYIWLYLDFVYGEKAYTAKAYGWLEEPKEIKRFDEFIAKIEGIIKDNTGGKEVKIPFSMSGYGVHSWNELDYAKKIKEEREQMISGKEEG